MELVLFCSQTNPLSNHLASNSRDASTLWVISAVPMDMLALTATWQTPICPPTVPHCCLPAPTLFNRENLQTSCTTRLLAVVWGQLQAANVLFGGDGSQQEPPYETMSQDGSFKTDTAPTTAHFTLHYLHAGRRFKHKLHISSITRNQNNLQKPLLISSVSSQLTITIRH
jgi:hypothetical protein